MEYRIEIEKKAVKFIEKQPQPQRIRIFSAIKKLPYSGDIKQMQGYENYFRLRVGDYRIIFTKQDDILLVRVVEAGNRGDIYKEY